MVLIDSDKQSEPTEHILRQGFGLTPAETGVAIGFARGRDFHEIANDQGLCIETVSRSGKSIDGKESDWDESRYGRDETGPELRSGAQRSWR